MADEPGQAMTWLDRWVSGLFHDKDWRHILRVSFALQAAVFVLTLSAGIHAVYGGRAVSALTNGVCAGLSLGGIVAVFLVWGGNAARDHIIRTYNREQEQLVNTISEIAIEHRHLKEAVDSLLPETQQKIADALREVASRRDH